MARPRPARGTTATTGEKPDPKASRTAAALPAASEPARPRARRGGSIGVRRVVDLAGAAQAAGARHARPAARLAVPHRAGVGARGAREPHARPGQRDDRRRPAVRAGLRRRLGPGLRRDPPDLRRRRHVWQGTFSVPAGGWQYKAALNNAWDENYGATPPGRRQHPARPGRRPERQVLLLTRDPLGHRQRDAGHRVGARQLPVRAGLPRRLAARLPPLVAPGPRRRRDLHLLDDRASRRAATRPRSRSTRAGTSTTARAASRPATTSTSPSRGNAKVTFSYDSVTHVLTIQAASLDPTHDNNVEWDGLRHDSRDTLYRTPGGAVPAGTPVTLRFRTFHNDVTGVKVRFYSVDRNGQQIVPMSIAASNVDCYQADLAGKHCDFWQATLPGSWGADNLWYRFIVTDGTDTDYYADDTAALDGGLGRPTDDAVDSSWALMLYVPGFTAPAWAKDAVIYQIFPDRFRNGRKDNDPQTGDVRYDVPVRQARLGRPPGGLLPQLRGRAARRPARPASAAPASSSPRAATTWAATSRASTSSSTTSTPSASTRSTSTRSSTPGPTTRTTPRTTRRSTPTSAPRRTGRTWSSTPTRRGSGSSSTACSTTCAPTARSSTATTTTPRWAPASRSPRRSAAGSSSTRSARATAPARAPAAAPRRATTAGSASTRSPSSTRRRRTRRSGSTS